MNSDESSMGASTGSSREPAPTAGVGSAAQMRLALTLGAEGMRVSFERAERSDPEFKAKAEAAILAHLSACPGLQCSGEDLVDVARAHGAVPHSDKAFGAVFQSLARKGLIRTVGFGLRRKGNGTAGARIWALCQ